MRKLVAGLAVSLDGFMEGPEGEWDWLIMDKDFDLATHMKRFDTFIMGRKTYVKLGDGGITSPNIKNYVFSKSLSNVKKGYQILNGDLLYEVNKIKSVPGKDIALYGGAELLTSLLQLKLIDELMMPVMPIILGKGKRFIGEITNRVLLTLMETKSFSSGVVILTYQIQ